MNNKITPARVRHEFHVVFRPSIKYSVKYIGWPKTTPAFLWRSRLAWFLGCCACYSSCRQSFTNRCTPPRSQLHGLQFHVPDSREESPIRQFASNYWTLHFAAYCELLVLFDYDFAPILGPYMTKIWDEKKRALKALDYFDFLDNDQASRIPRRGLTIQKPGIVFSS